MKITAKTVADACGVSLATVSRAFRADASISGDLRQRILTSAQELGYTPPAPRQRKRTGRQMIGLIVGDIENPFYPSVLKRFASQTSKNGLDMIVHVVPPGQSVDDIFELVLATDVDALVVTSAILPSKLVSACKARGVPVVLFNRIQTDPNLNAVCADNYGGSKLVADRFRTAGHRRICFVGGLARTSTHLERRRGFMDGLVSCEVIEVSGDFEYQMARRAVDEVLKASNPPTAVFCANDLMAFAAIDAAKSLGMAPGSDIDVVGYDDVPMASWSSYKLTTVSQQIDTLVGETLHLIKSLTQQSEGQIRVVPAKLIARKSG